MTQTSAGIGRYADRSLFNLSYGVQDGKYEIPSAESEEEHAGEDHDHEEGHDHEEPHSHEHVNIDWRRHNVRFTADGATWMVSSTASARQ